jgi:hypothetical protein
MTAGTARRYCRAAASSSAAYLSQALDPVSACRLPATSKPHSTKSLGAIASPVGLIDVVSFHI